MEKEKKVYEITAENGLSLKTVFSPSRKDIDGSQWQQIDNNICAIMQKDELICVVDGRTTINEALKSLLIETKHATPSDFEIEKVAVADKSDSTQVWILEQLKDGQTEKQIIETLKSQKWTIDQLKPYFKSLNVSSVPVPPPPR